MSWVTEAGADWTKATGGGLISLGRLGKALKPLLRCESWETVRPAWQHYLKVTLIQFASPERFVATYGEWRITPKVQPLGPKVKLVEDMSGHRSRLVEVPFDDPRPAA